MPQTKPKPIPDRYRRVTPALVVDGADRALEFYGTVFGATERVRLPGPDGRIAHAEIEIGDSVLIVEDGSASMGTQAPPSGGLDGTPVFLFLYVEDVDGVIEHAARLGATVKRRAENQFYGDRDGFIVDPFGHGWTIASHVEDVTPRRDEPSHERVRRCRVDEKDEEEAVDEVRPVVRRDREVRARARADEPDRP